MAGTLGNLVGRVVAGKYEVTRLVGSGGTGIVVAARHMKLRHEVAIKFLRKDLVRPQTVLRFEREALVLVQLKSEHVARVFDFGTMPTGEPFLVMELLDGANLADVLATNGPLPVDLAVEYILQACEAIAEAHADGIVHRDIKPANLLLTKTVDGRPRVKVVDFGMATRLLDEGGTLTTSSSILGSPKYMPPEQMRSAEEVDARADVWALGVTLYELLADDLPFREDSERELCAAVLNAPPRSLLDLRPATPPGLVAAIERCLEKEPARRFDDVLELATQIAPFGPPGARDRLSRIESIASTAKTTLSAEALAAARVAAAATLAQAKTAAVASPPATARRMSRTALSAGLVFVTVAVLGTAAGIAFLSWRRTASPGAVDAASAPTTLSPETAPAKR